MRLWQNRCPFSSDGNSAAVYIREEGEKRPELSGRFCEENYAGKRILLVEDNALNREIATEIIGMTGVTIDIAETEKLQSKR